MKIVLSILLGLLISNHAFAGSTCNAEFVNDPAIMKDAANTAIKLKSFLDQNRNADVFYIARIGSDAMKHGVKYTHSAFVVRNNEDYDVIHLLNECGTGNSSIYSQGLMNFYLDSLHNMHTVVIIPDADLQRRLKKILRSGEALRLHSSHYNMISYPFATKYQNSNQWLLETTAMALNSNVTNRYEAQQVLKSMGFTPQLVKIPATEKISALFKAYIVFTDHPKDEQKRKEYSVATGDSILSFLRKLDKIEKIYEF